MVICHMALESLGWRAEWLYDTRLGHVGSGILNSPSSHSFGVICGLLRISLAKGKWIRALCFVLFWFFSLLEKWCQGAKESCGSCAFFPCLSSLLSCPDAGGGQHSGLFPTRKCCCSGEWDLLSSVMKSIKGISTTAPRTSSNSSTLSSSVFLINQRNSCFGQSFPS